MKKFFSIILAIIVLAGVVYGTGYGITGQTNPLNWVETKKEQGQEQGKFENDGAAGAVLNDGGAVVGVVGSNDITVLCAELPRVAYAANGVAESADTAYLLTYTVLPADTTDKSVDIGLDFVDSQSEWAQGKVVTDYVTAVYQGDCKILVTCLAPFGEQIKLSLSAKNGSKATAECTVDYLRKPTAATPMIGVISLAQTATITPYFGRSDTIYGGLVTLSVEYVSDYTIEGEFTEKVSLSHVCQDFNEGSKIYQAFYGSAGLGRLDYDDADDILGRSIYFDRRLFGDFNFYLESYIDPSISMTQKQPRASLTDIRVDYLKTQMVFLRGYAFWTVTTTIEGNGKSFAYSVNLNCGTIDWTVPADSVSPDVPSITF